MLLPDKSALKSMTAWGVFLLALGQAAESVSFLPPGLTAQVQAVVVPLGTLLTGLGIRRVLGQP
jgi:membrane protein implicated in regulation of membrane protease activity